MATPARVVITNSSRIVNLNIRLLQSKTLAYLTLDRHARFLVCQDAQASKKTPSNSPSACWTRLCRMPSRMVSKTCGASDIVLGSSCTRCLTDVAAWIASRSASFRFTISILRRFYFACLLFSTVVTWFLQMSLNPAMYSASGGNPTAARRSSTLAGSSRVSGSHFPGAVHMPCVP